MLKINESNLKSFLSDEISALEIYRGMVGELNQGLDLETLDQAEEELADFKIGLKRYVGLKGKGLDWFGETVGLIGTFGVKVGMFGVDSDLKAFEFLQRVSSGAYGTNVGWWRIKEIAEEAGDFQLARLASGAIAFSERQLEVFEGLLRLIGHKAFFEEEFDVSPSLKYLKGKVKEV